MELRQLRYFATLATELNFHRAAEALHIAQPPLSVTIRKLEEELGVQLVERLPRGVRLTPAGEICVQLAKEILERAETLKQAASELAGGKRGRLRIGFVGSAAYSIIPTIIPIFKAKYPAIDLKLREATTLDIIRDLEVGTLDAGIVRTPIFTATSANIHPLATERLVLAVPATHRLRFDNSIPLAELRDESFVVWDSVATANYYTLVVVSCEREGFIPKVAEHASQIHTVIALVESGLGVALVPSTLRSAGDQRVRYLDVTCEGKEICIGLDLMTPAGDLRMITKRFVDLAVGAIGNPTSPSRRTGIT